MKYYDIMDKDEKGSFITFQNREDAESWLSKQGDRFLKGSIRYNIHVVENERLTINERNEKAFTIANNAIYFNDRSDYLSALHEVCKMLKPQIEENLIGNKYIMNS